MMNRKEINNRVKAHPEEAFNEIKRSLSTFLKSMCIRIEEQKYPGYLLDLIWLVQEKCHSTTKETADYMIEAGIRDGQKGRAQEIKSPAKSG